jgi:hypothetical protein
MQDISQLETEQISADKQLAGRIISYINSLQKNKLDWFWQLLANGLDNVDPAIPFKVKINFKTSNCVEFEHSGKVFRQENLTAIVNQSTTKAQ